MTTLARWALWILVGCVAGATGCGGGAAGSSADGPADCAGPARAVEGRTRYEAWDRAVAALRSSKAPQSIWLGFSDLVGTDDATSMFAATQIEGIRLAYREQGGLTAKGNFPIRPPVQGAQLAPMVQRFLDFELASAVGTLAPANGAGGKGAAVLAGLQMRVDYDEFASLVSLHRCLIYSVEAAPATPTFLSPRIEPDSATVSTETGPAAATTVATR